MAWTDLVPLPPDRTVAVLPVGAMEAHGPHLPLGTDVVIAEAMAAEGSTRLAARGLEVVLLPALPFGVAPFAADFPGTIDASPDVVTRSVIGIAESLARHGVRLTAIANAHHDPAHVAALRAAVAGARAHRAALVFPDLTRRRWAARLTDEFLSGACHAGRYETSILLAARPDWVRTEAMRSLTANPRSLVQAAREGKQTFREAGGPLAYFGCPADASADEGRRTIETLGMILEEAVLAALPTSTISPVTASPEP